MNGSHYPREWEIVNSNLRRLKIPSGWITVVSERVIVQGKEIHVSVQQIEIQDDGHEWVLENK
jgi:predicted RNA-binding protein associated with RNAse of E/G family